MRRELYEHSCGAHVWLLLTAAAILTLLACGVGITVFRSRHAAYDALAVQRTADGLRSDGRLSGGQVESALRAIRPPNPLTIVVEASLDNDFGYWDFGPGGYRVGSGALDASHEVTPFGITDVRHTVTIVLSLLALSLAWTSVADDRARGSLRALLAQPIQPSAVFVGKYVSGALTLSLAVGLTLGIAAMVLAIHPTAAFSLTDWISLAALAVPSVLFLLANLSIGLLIGSVIPGYRPALIATVLIWVFSTLLVASAADSLPRMLWPTPPTDVVEAQYDEIAQAMFVRTQVEMGDAFGRTGHLPAISGAALTTDPEGLRLAESIWNRNMRALRAELQQRRDTLSTTVSRRTAMENALRWLSPACVYWSVSADLTGLGSAETARWTESVHAYQGYLERALFDNRPRLTAQVSAAALGINAAGRALVTVERHAVPRVSQMTFFAAPHDSAWQRIRDAAPMLFVLLIYNVISFVLALITFTRVRLDISTQSASESES